MAEPRRMIAIAFGPPSMAEAATDLPRIRAQADCVELRLDLYQQPFDLPTLLRQRGDLPAVVTLRPADQGGKSPLPPGELLKVPPTAAELSAALLDAVPDS